MTERQETNGEVLKRYAREIKSMKNLVESMQEIQKGGRISHKSKANTMIEGTLSLYKDEIGRLQEIYDGLVNMECPKPSSLVCPHCGYDGEFDVDAPKHEGFRLLTPILEARQVISYENGVFMLHCDPGDSHDPFTEIAEPYFVECIDGEGKSDEFERALRERLKAQHLLLCGKCLKNFSAREFVTNCLVDYALGQHKWG